MSNPDIATGKETGQPDSTAAKNNDAVAAAAVTGPSEKADSPVVHQADDEDDVETKDPDLGLCGFPADLDFALWEECDPVPRIKESLLTPEQKAKFRGHLDKIFHPDTIKGVRVDFPPNDVLEVAEMIIPYLASESMLIDDVPFDVVIVADLHGQLYDLARVFRADEKDGKPGWECMKYVFLGDYVDRGRHSLEIVMALYCIKMLHPDRIFLLRGNHEFFHSNSRYGFAFDFYDRYAIEETWRALYWKMNESFCYLSIAAIVGNIYFCAHGGISPSGFTRKYMQSIRKPIMDSRKDFIVHDVVWSDIANGLRGSTYNGGRGTSIYFGLDTLCLALYNMDCKALFRGHTMVLSGYEIIGHVCINLFTATGTAKFNDGAVAYVDPLGKVSFRVLKCNKQRVAWVNKLKRRDGAVEGRVIPATDTNGDEVTTYGKDDTGDGKIPNFNQNKMKAI